MVSKERHEGEYALQMIPSVIPPIDSRREVRHKLAFVADCSDRNAPLHQVLQWASPEASDSILIDYEYLGREYSRLFILTRDERGNVVFSPMPSTRRGESKIPEADVAEISKLRMDRMVAGSMAPQLRELEHKNEQIRILRVPNSSALGSLGLGNLHGQS